MNERPALRLGRPGARALLVAAASLSLLLLASTLPVAAQQYQASRPISDKKSGSSTRKVALGMATPDGRSLAEVDSFTASMGGKKPAIWVIWSQWGLPSSKQFPMAMANGLKARKITPMVWWEPVDPRDLSDPTYARHKFINRGDHDAYVRQWARDAKAFGSTVLLRFAHEMNNKSFPWSINSFDNSPASFKAAWRRVRDIFRQEGASNVKFVWSVNKQRCAGGCNPYPQIYPGDAYVDYMAFTGYNWGARPDKTWQSMYESYKLVVKRLREVSNKPIMVAETGSSSIGGDKAAWIRAGYREVYKKFPQIVAIVWLNADLRNIGLPDWRIGSPASALAAYREIAGLARFDTRWPIRSSSQAKMARLDGTRKKTQKAEPASAKQPRVQKGSAAPTGSQDATKSAARNGRNKTTRKSRKKGTEPPAVLESFGR